MVSLVISLRWKLRPNFCFSLSHPGQCATMAVFTLEDALSVWTNFNGAETNCRIAHISGILLMNSCNTDIFFFNNYYHLQSVRFELGKHSLLVGLYASTIKTGTRRIIRLDEPSSVVRLKRRTTEDSSSRRIMRPLV